jgi:hypothetical protein
MVEKMGVQWDSTWSFKNFKIAWDSVRRELLYIIRTELQVPMKLDRLIKMCLNETYSKAIITGFLTSFIIPNSKY